MPGLDGYEATRRIRAKETQERRLPIVAATAHAFDSEREKTADAGMDDHLPKPISMNALSTMIARWAKTEPNATIDVPPLSASANTPAPVEPDVLKPPEVPILDPEVPRSPTVVRVFKTHVPEQLDRISQAIKSSDGHELSQAAHRLKGSCTMFGAPRMADLCLNLERGNGDPHALFAMLVQEHEHVLSVLPQS